MHYLTQCLSQNVSRRMPKWSHYVAGQHKPIYNPCGTWVFSSGNCGKYNANIINYINLAITPKKEMRKLYKNVTTLQSSRRSSPSVLALWPPHDPPCWHCNNDEMWRLKNLCLRYLVWFWHRIFRCNCVQKKHIILPTPPVFVWNMLKPHQLMIPPEPFRPSLISDWNS